MAIAAVLVVVMAAGVASAVALAAKPVTPPARRWGRFRYKVYRERIVPPTDVSIRRNVGYQQLILTACHPPHTALKRYFVFARRIVGRQGKHYW